MIGRNGVLTKSPAVVGRGSIVWLQLSARSEPIAGFQPRLRPVDHVEASGRQCLAQQNCSASRRAARSAFKLGGGGLM
jgi:hypothetical protein